MMACTGDIGSPVIEALRRLVPQSGVMDEATALVGLFNFTGRLEAASGLPPDQIPARARFAEGRPDRLAKGAT